MSTDGLALVYRRMNAMRITAEEMTRALVVLGSVSPEVLDALLNVVEAQRMEPES